MEKIIWIGLDVHKESIAVAAAEPALEGPSVPPDKVWAG